MRNIEIRGINSARPEQFFDDPLAIRVLNSLHGDGGIWRDNGGGQAASEANGLNVIERANQDVPLHDRSLTTETSSIGGLWPPERASFDRIKGIFTKGIIRSVGEIEEVRLTIGQARQEGFSDGISRVSVRAVIDLFLLREQRGLLRPVVEAIIPLKGTQPHLEDTALVYLGVNREDRQSDPVEVQRYWAGLTSVLENLTPRPYRDSLDRVTQDGYQVNLLVLPAEEPGRNEIIDQVAFLYERFGWTREEVVEILENPNNLMVTATKDGEIASAGIAEMATIPIGDTVIRVAEITEAATSDKHARRGIYTAVSTKLLEILAAKSRNGEFLGGELDLVYGECNGNAHGVTRTARIQGRIFSTQVGFDLGYPHSGMLPQHVPIAGGKRKTPYNDLFPAFLTREHLYKIIES